MKMGKKTLFPGILISFILALTAIPAMAGGAVGNQDMEETVRMLMEQNEALMKQNRELSQRLHNLESEVAEMKQAPAEEAKPVVEAPAEEEQPWYHRIAIEGGVTGVLQASANNANNNPDGGNKADGEYTVDLNVESDLGKYGMFHIHVEGGDGDGLNDDVPSFSVPNYDAYATWDSANRAELTFSEAFYENTFWDNKVDFNIGKMDISVLFDENAAAGDETTQFLSNIFVKSMGLTVEEPDDFYCPAFMVSVSPIDLVEFRVIGASVDSEEEGSQWENIFSDGFAAVQMNIKPRILNRPGNYRFYGWYDSRRYLDNSNLATATNDYKEGSDGLGGWGLSFDQEVADGLTAFARYSWRDADVAKWDGASWEILPFSQTYSVGMDISGSLWNRGGDAVGMAFGQTILTDDWKDEQKLAGEDTSNEEYVEVYYRYAVFERMALTADFQWIGDPGGLKGNDDAYLFGIRSQIDF